MCVARMPLMGATSFAVRCLPPASLQSRLSACAEQGNKPKGTALEFGKASELVNGVPKMGVQDGSFLDCLVRLAHPNSSETKAQAACNLLALSCVASQ